jgi:hypothetical protein
MRIMLDLDDCITAAPTFFSTFSRCLKDCAEIHVVTHRPLDQLDMTIEDLKQLGIHYDHLELTHDKLAYVLEQGITVVFEDTDHYFKYMPEHITVFKIREDGNFDFKSRRWIYSDKDGVHVEDLP